MEPIELPKTLQEWFNVAWNWAVVEKHPPCIITDDDEGGGVCLYRSEGGNRCLLGAGIPDALYKPEMEAKNIGSVLSNFFNSGETEEEINLRYDLRELQSRHDDAGIVRTRENAKSRTATRQITPELLAALILGGGPGVDTMDQRNPLSFGDFDGNDGGDPKVEDPGDHPLSQNEEVLLGIQGRETLTPAGFNLTVANLQREYGLELEPARQIAGWIQA